MNATVVILVSLITAWGSVEQHTFEMPSMEACLQSVQTAKISGEYNQLFCIEQSMVKK